MSENDSANKLRAEESKDELDLDDLLDSALDDFNTLNLNKRSKEPVGEVQGLGLGLPDLAKKKLKQKPAKPHVSEALDKLREQTHEAVKGLGSPEDPAIEDWVNQFQELASSQDMESIMETMMQQLLSKEILHKPMKEIEEKYPKWLEEHRSSLSQEDYERYSQQHQFIKSLNKVYEEEPSDFNKIVDLMQKMQECGQPPSDILNHIDPDFAAQLSPDMLGSPGNCPVM